MSDLHAGGGWLVARDRFSIALDIVCKKYVCMYVDRVRGTPYSLLDFELDLPIYYAPLSHCVKHYRIYHQVCPYFSLTDPA